jgi:hypothetical protein
MKRFGAAFLVVLICAAPAFAADFPTRKAGLWEMDTNTANGHAVKLQECVDAQTDQAMQSRFASMPQRNCSKRDVQKSADTITVNSVCTIGGQTMNNHMVITGSFDSSYTMTMTTQTQGAPIPPRTVTMTAKWLGPCAAGQRPGDMIMPNGMKMNMLDLQKGMPGAAGAPGGAMAPHP